MLITDDVGQDPAFLKDMAQSLEGAGFDAVLANDHVVGGHPDRQRPGEKVHTYDVPCHEPLVLLTFIGAVTTRLELATSIVISTQRQTVLLAKQTAELDLLTGGRLRLGVGIGEAACAPAAPTRSSRPAMSAWMISRSSAERCRAVLAPRVGCGAVGRPGWPGSTSSAKVLASVP